MPELLRTLLAFALVLGVLVFIHELGHYLGLDEEDLQERDLE